MVSLLVFRLTRWLMIARRKRVHHGTVMCVLPSTSSIVHIMEVVVLYLYVFFDHLVQTRWLVGLREPVRVAPYPIINLQVLTSQYIHTYITDRMHLLYGGKIRSHFHTFAVFSCLMTLAVQ